MVHGSDTPEVVSSAFEPLHSCRLRRLGRSTWVKMPKLAGCGNLDTKPCGMLLLTMGGCIGRAANWFSSETKLGHHLFRLPCVSFHPPWANTAGRDKVSKKFSNGLHISIASDQRPPHGGQKNMVTMQVSEHSCAPTPVVSMSKWISGCYASRRGKNLSCGTTHSTDCTEAYQLVVFRQWRP